MKTIYIKGRYKIVKSYDKAYKRFFFHTYYVNHEKPLFTHNAQRDAIRALNQWIEINGAY